jgi:hypothetical protein
MPPQNRDFFLGRERPSLLVHGENLLGGYMLTGKGALSSSD